MIVSHNLRLLTLLSRRLRKARMRSGGNVEDDAGYRYPILPPRVVKDRAIREKEGRVVGGGWMRTRRVNKGALNLGAGWSRR